MVPSETYVTAVAAQGRCPCGRRRRAIYGSRLWFGVVAGLLLMATSASAQSLAEVARQEQARRKSIKHPGKVYTNKDLPGDSGGGSIPAETTVSEPGTPAATGGPEAGSAASTPKPAEVSAPQDQPLPVQDEAYLAGAGHGGPRGPRADPSPLRRHAEPDQRADCGLQCPRRPGSAGRDCQRSGSEAFRRVRTAAGRSQDEGAGDLDIARKRPAGPECRRDGSARPSRSTPPGTPFAFPRRFASFKGRGSDATWTAICERPDSSTARRIANGAPRRGQTVAADDAPPAIEAAGMASSKPRMGPRRSPRCGRGIRLWFCRPSAAVRRRPRRAACSQGTRSRNCRSLS